MDVESAVASWSADYVLDPGETALVASVEGPRGRQTLAIVAHGLMGQGGACVPMAVVLEEAHRHLAAAATREDVAAPEGELDAMARAAHQALLGGRKRQPLYDYIGATFAAAWLSGERVTLAHSGDCQIYVRRAGGELVKLTADHTLHEEYRRLHPDQWKDEYAEQLPNVIVRCLGMAVPASSASEGSPAPPPSMWDITSVDAGPGDIFLLLTSGADEPVDGRAGRALRFDIEPGEALEGALARFFEALPKGGRRELSAAAVRLVDHAVEFVPERVAGRGRMPDMVKKLFGAG